MGFLDKYEIGFRKDWRKHIDTLETCLNTAGNVLSNAHRSQDDVDFAHDIQCLEDEMNIYLTNFSLRVCDWLNEKQSIFHFSKPKDPYHDYFDFCSYQGKSHMSFYFPTYFKKVWLLPKSVIFADEIPQEYLDSLKECVIRDQFTPLDWYNEPGKENVDYVCFTSYLNGRADVDIKPNFDLYADKVKYICIGTKEKCVKKMRKINTPKQSRVVVIKHGEN